MSAPAGSPLMPASPRDVVGWDGRAVRMDALPETVLPDR